MKVLLQNTESKFFYRGRGAWTPNPDEAFDFQYSRGLPDFSESLESADVELVVTRDFDRPCATCNER